MNICLPLTSCRKIRSRSSWTLKHVISASAWWEESEVQIRKEKEAENLLNRKNLREVEERSRARERERERERESVCVCVCVRSYLDKLFRFRYELLFEDGFGDSERQTEKDSRCKWSRKEKIERGKRNRNDPPHSPHLHTHTHTHTHTLSLSLSANVNCYILQRFEFGHRYRKHSH